MADKGDLYEFMVEYCFPSLNAPSKITGAITVGKELELLSLHQ